MTIAPGRSKPALSGATNGVAAQSDRRQWIVYWRGGGGLDGHGAGAACCCAGVPGAGAGAAVLGLGLGAVFFLAATGFLTGLAGCGAAGVNSTCTGLGRISGMPALFETGSIVSESGR